jgi:hypothetical protein
MNGSISANSLGIVDTPGEFVPLREQFVIIDPLKFFAFPNRQHPGAS